MFTLLGSNIKQAIGSLVVSKLRSLLTMLGIIIGVASVIVMLGAGRGAEELIVQQVEDLGSNVIFMLPGGDGGKRRGPPAAVRGVVVKSMKMKDVESLIRSQNALGIRNVSSSTSSFSTVVRTPGTDDEKTISIQGRDRGYFNTGTYDYLEGGLWSEADEKAVKKVILLGIDAKVDIFGENAGNVVGDNVKVKGQNFKVVGVFETSGGLGAAFGQGGNSQIVVPTEAAQKFLLGVDYLGSLQFEVIKKENIESAISGAESILRRNHKIKDGEENDFSIRSQQDAVDVLGSIKGVFTVFLSAVAAISLFVGGIGIMNIMLVVVTERTKEIGLRKAIGAKRSDILTQFLTEAVVLTLFGGIIGVTIGLLGSYGLSQVGGWTFRIDLTAVALALSVSASFGIVFGMYPANKASLLDPIEAMRYE